jgi:long-chain acyl-CoA synthetase
MVFLASWCERHSRPCPAIEDVPADAEICARITADVEGLMGEFASWERVKQARVLPAMFTIEDGELTPTLKLKRKPILARYADLIDSIYA